MRLNIRNSRIQVLLFLLPFFTSSVLTGAEQKFLSPKQEAEQLINCGKKTNVLLSEAICDMIYGVADIYFTDLTTIQQLERQSYTGEHIEYWDNGQKKLQVTFLNGKPDGHLHAWYDNGEEAFKGFFYEGRKAGIHLVFFNPDLGPTHYTRIARVLRYTKKGQLDGKILAKNLSIGPKTVLIYKKGKLSGDIQYFE